MAQVTVTIDGKAYRMACDEGQEEHLIDLAQRFDRYVSHLKDLFGEIGDQRLTVMAGIMVMDELSELQKRVKGMESESQHAAQDARRRADQGRQERLRADRRARRARRAHGRAGDDAGGEEGMRPLARSSRRKFRCHFPGKDEFFAADLGAGLATSV